MGCLGLIVNKALTAQEQPSSLIMTDFPKDVLENLQYNIEINRAIGKSKNLLFIITRIHLLNWL